MVLRKMLPTRMLDSSDSTEEECNGHQTKVYNAKTLICASEMCILTHGEAVVFRLDENIVKFAHPHDRQHVKRSFGHDIADRQVVQLHQATHRLIFIEIIQPPRANVHVVDALGEQVADPAGRHHGQHERQHVLHVACGFKHHHR